ncbi:helix-turn-helix domain-containing protein, partial [Consotaella aegiceratis]|uniref:MmyB family transcriptional regulator n=1 Tax=Consotaella aegiceratis TaxID=3097961 RepID=UPI002F3E3651
YPIILKPMTTDEQRRLLGQFIRSHRERTLPDAVVRRRRTPGLRREELAARAGIGVTWCAWIEQGRDISVSPDTLARLANALALTPAERAYLFELAGRRDPSAPKSAPTSEAPEGLAALVEALPHPAYGLDRLWNACCWNGAAEHLFSGWLGDGRHRNLLRYTFTAPSARRLLPDWDQRARRLLAEFRSDCARMLDDRGLNDLIGQLRDESELFAQEWDAQTVMAREGGLRTFLHPQDGALSYVQHTFSPAERPDYKLVALVPASPGQG